MKFTKFKFIYLLCIFFLSFSLSKKSFKSFTKTGIEQQDIVMNIFNNVTQLVSSGDINIKLTQNQQAVNGTNKYVGYWQTSIKTPLRVSNFTQHIPNFGRLVGDNAINLDFRYIMGCSFDVKEEADLIKTAFQMMSKESTNQHVYGIEFNLPSNGNNIEEIKKYFEGISKICSSSQETATIVKNLLSEILSVNLALKKLKISQILLDTNSSSSQIYVSDITDPNVKSKISELNETIQLETQNIKKLKEEKTKLFSRAQELMNRMDKDNQQLSVIEPKNEEYVKNAASANLTLISAQSNITNITAMNDILNSTLQSSMSNKTNQDNSVTALDAGYNNIKADLNKILEEETNLKKAIAENGAKANVITQTLLNIETKKKGILEKITELTAEIKKDGDDVESNQKNLNLAQTNFNNFHNEIKKLQTNIEELKNKLREVMKKENDIKQQIDPKALSALQTQQQSTITQLSDLEKTLLPKKSDVMSIIDPQFGRIIDQAYAEIVNKDNFDPQSYINILKTIPSFVWQVPS